MTLESKNNETETRFTRTDKNLHGSVFRSHWTRRTAVQVFKRPANLC